MTGEQVAERALSHVGTAFRLHGRKAGVALDCVGLAAVSFGVRHFPSDYSLKGEFLDRLFSYLEHSQLQFIDPNGDIEDGDLAIVTPSPSQIHLMIRALRGWVHGHAGLRRVVHTPGQSPWPIVALLRLNGD